MLHSDQFVNAPWTGNCPVCGAIHLTHDEVKRIILACLRNRSELSFKLLAKLVIPFEVKQ